MNCTLCGKHLPNKSLKGADYLPDSQGNWFCMNCVRQCLDRWPQFEKYEQLAEEPERYRNALVDTLRWAINEGYCNRPREHCRAEPEKCLRCWMKFLVGE